MSSILANSHLSLGDFHISLSPLNESSRIVSVTHQGSHELFIEVSNFTEKLWVSKRTQSIIEHARSGTDSGTLQQNAQDQTPPEVAVQESRQPPPSSSHDFEAVPGLASGTLILSTSLDSDNEDNFVEHKYVNRGFSSDSTDLGSGRLRIDTGSHSIEAPGDQCLVDTTRSKMPRSTENGHRSNVASPTSTVEETPQHKKNMDPQFSFGLIQVGSGSTLHDACAQRSISLQQLRSVLSSDIRAVSKPDLTGKLPLHILSENEALLEHRKGRETAYDFALELIDLNPAGILTKDKEGIMPFTTLLLFWVDRVRQSQTLHNDSGATTFMDFEQIITNPRRSKQNDSQPFQDGDIPKCESMDASMRKYFPDVDVTPSVEWSFFMLSFCLDYISGKQSRAKRRSRKWQRAARAALAENVASVPSLLQTIFLIEDDDVRNRLLELSIIRRVLLCASSAGPWIESMLQQRGIVSHRAVDYFVVLSGVTVKDFNGRGRAPRAEDVCAFREVRGKVVERIQSMPDILPSLLVLSNKEMERAATTDVVWTALNSGVSRPFVVATVVIGFVLHVAIIAAFRQGVLLFNPTDLVLGTLGDRNIFIVLVLTICVHFAIRKLGEGISLALASKEVFRSFFLNFWNLIDVATIVMAMISSTLIHQGFNYPEFNAVVVGLLWLKLIGFLKALNLQLATFILAVVEIILDVRWFMLIVLLAILMFGDMMHILSTQTNNGAVCVGDLDLAVDDFCTDRYLDSYLRMYTVLLGDFNLHTYRDLASITAIFVMFTLLGFIVLLNVLIAVVSDSYERSRLSSKHLFGRARVGFLAEHISLERFLHSKYRSFNGLSSGKYSSIIVALLCRCGRWTVLLSLLGTALLSEAALISAMIHSIRDGNASGTVLAAVLCIVLTAALVAVITVLFNDCIGRRTNFLTSWTDRGIRFLSTRLLNASSPETTVEGEAEDEWHGRLEYLSRTVEKLVADTERNVCLAVRTSESRLMEHEKSLASDLKTQINSSEHCD